MVCATILSLTEKRNKVESRDENTFQGLVKSIHGEVHCEARKVQVKARSEPPKKIFVRFSIAIWKKNIFLP